jgi:hypothetical protein
LCNPHDALESLAQTNSRLLDSRLESFNAEATDIDLAYAVNG